MSGRDKRFHLAWFTNAVPHGWMDGKASPWAGNDITEWMTGEFLIDMARSLDRACFDYIMLEDHVAFDHMAGLTARLDPISMMPLMAEATTGLGVVATMSTSFYPPFLLARTAASLDHLTRGRMGWNIVTTSEHEAAHAFGMEAQPSHGERYERAAEYTDLVCQLWDGWDPDAIVMNEETGQYVDPSKVKRLDFQGKYYKCKGALNIARSPQGRPVLCQAGTSERGRDFSAKYADTILVSTGGANDYGVMKEIRDDIRSRAVKIGRDPDEIKLLYMITPIMAESEAEAERLWHLRKPPLTPASIKGMVEGLSRLGQIDLTQYDLDEPLPFIDITKLDGHQATFNSFYRSWDGKKTFREMLARRGGVSSLDLFGTPTQVADRMEEAMEAIGGDGFLLQCRPLTRRYITEVTEGLVPILQKRGLVRKKYEHTQLRDNLREF
ncbi:NtaA/DmoA family FMN-dependent monooxygenase [Granulicella sibirica]|uniref:Nitrilotriacetate monooxygenase component A n=1 Tax=Granulicella sibirica TaxID=2479048 RepID=A0A4Q0SYU7_9BACT|nr:NtaA/DmoA family FMN-dependent monooxygenase [Granulicella sibirica]RXH54709.1 Nitrilotriacetate monooxygenase component A [Granulicella sibirica]